MAVQSLKPRIDMIKARYGEDNKRVQAETKVSLSRLIEFDQVFDRA